MRVPAGGGGHGCGVERQDVAFVAHRDAQVGGQPVAGDHDARGGGDIDDLPADRVETTTAAPANSGAPVAVAAVGHQRLPGGGAGLADHHRVWRRYRGQRFGRGNHRDRGASVGGGP